MTLEKMNKQKKKLRLVAIVWMLAAPLKRSLILHFLILKLLFLSNSTQMMFKSNIYLFSSLKTTFNLIPLKITLTNHPCFNLILMIWRNPWNATKNLRVP